MSEVIRALDETEVESSNCITQKQSLVSTPDTHTSFHMGRGTWLSEGGQDMQL